MTTEVTCALQKPTEPNCVHPSSYECTRGLAGIHAVIFIWIPLTRE